MINIIDKEKILLVTEIVQLQQNSTWIILINISKVLKLLEINTHDMTVPLEIKLVLPPGVAFIPLQGEKIILKDHRSMDDVKLSWKIQVANDKLHLDTFKIQITT